MKIPILTLSLFLTVHSCCLLQAQENYLVHWEGEYAESETLLNLGESVFTENGEVWGLDSISLLSPAAHYDIHGTSAKFYGILEAKSSGETTGLPQARISKAPDGSDRMAFRSAGAAGDHPMVSYQGLLFWKKEDFLVSAESLPALALEALQTFSLQIPFVRGEVEIHFAVMSQGEWYLSETAWTASTGSGGDTNGVFELGDPANTLWGKWPQSTSSVQLEAAPFTYLTEGTKLADITAVGFYFTTTFKKNNRASVELSSFSVSHK